MRYELKLEKERRFERFDRRLRLVSSQDRRTLEFGNSGLIIFVDGKVGLFHFTPEHTTEPSESTDKRIKYKIMLGSALYGLWEWLNGQPLEDGLKNIEALTNRVLARAIGKLFRRFGHDCAIKIEDGLSQIGERITIDTIYFRLLEINDPLVVELKDYDELAKKLDGVWC